MSRKEELRQKDLAKPPPKASSIFCKEMDNTFANIKGFLQNLMENIEITHTNVGQSFDYPDGIIENDIYLEYGIFMNYFIRKHLSNQYHTDIEDIAVEVVLNKPDVYFKDKGLKQYILDHYNIFRDPNKNAMDILEDIKIVSLAYSATYDEERVRDDQFNIDSEDEMLLEIIKYFKNLPFKNVTLTPTLDCNYFRATPDFIFDNGEVLYNIKTSKSVTLASGDDTFSPTNFYILIAYAYAYYKKFDGNRIRTIVIYNPLLGYEHKIDLKNIDFEEFERCIEKDYVKKYGENWRKNPPTRW